VRGRECIVKGRKGKEVYREGLPLRGSFPEDPCCKRVERNCVYSSEL
jgi:hypothetical protein